jgi:hypothetical protein
VLSLPHHRYLGSAADAHANVDINAYVNIDAYADGNVCSADGYTGGYLDDHTHGDLRSPARFPPHAYACAAEADIDINLHAGTAHSDSATDHLADAAADDHAHRGYFDRDANAYSPNGNLHAGSANGDRSPNGADVGSHGYADARSGDAQSDGDASNDDADADTGYADAYRRSVHPHAPSADRDANAHPPDSNLHASSANSDAGTSDRDTAAAYANSGPSDGYTGSTDTNARTTDADVYTSAGMIAVLSCRSQGALGLLWECYRPYNLFGVG